MIEVRNVSKRFGDRAAVRSVSFEVRPGVVTGYLGPNGAGKTTTLRMILGLDSPTSGSATIEGTPYRSFREPLRVVGSLLDANWVHPRRSVRAHLRWLAASNGIAAARIGTVLEQVGLFEVARKRCGELSLGMRQRLGLAAALLGEPRHLILDEPVNGLDPEGIQWLRGFLKRFAGEGRSVLMSSHLLGEVAQTADELIVIARGELRATGTVEEFVSRSARPLVRVRAEDLDGLSAALSRAGLSEQERRVGTRGPELVVLGASGRQVGELAAHHQIVLSEISEESASLEEAFMTALSDDIEYRGSL